MGPFRIHNVILAISQRCKMSQIWQIYLCKFSWTEMIWLNKLTCCNPDFNTDASVSGWIGEKREVGSFVGN